MRTFALKCLPVLAIALASTATPSLATEWVFCGPNSNAAEVALLVGSEGLTTASAVILRAARDEWVTDAVYGEGAPLTIGQTFEDEETIRMDFLDEAYAVIGQLRLFKAEEGKYSVNAGTLRIVGKGAWTVTCDDL